MKRDPSASPVNPDQPIRLPASRIEQVSGVLARAFQDDPIFGSLLPDRVQRMQWLTGLFDAVLRYCLRYGQVYTDPEGHGAACWLAPGRTGVTPGRMLLAGLGIPRAVAKLPGDARRQLLQVLAYLEREHKRLMAQPHWYLWAVGVEPAYQRQGIGGRLLQPILARADEEQVPCYVETQVESNLPFYRKWGFVVVGQGQVLDQGLPMWMMRREPRQPTG